jgi:hypothetical protein
MVGYMHGVMAGNNTCWSEIWEGATSGQWRVTDYPRFTTILLTYPLFWDVALCHWAWFLAFLDNFVVSKCRAPITQ